MQTLCDVGCFAAVILLPQEFPHETIFLYASQLGFMVSLSSVTVCSSYVMLANCHLILIRFIVNLSLVVLFALAAYICESITQS